MQMNQNALELLYSSPPLELMVDPAAALMIAEGFEWHRGALKLVAWKVAMPDDLASSSFQDLTGYEATANSTHVEALGGSPAKGFLTPLLGTLDHLVKELVAAELSSGVRVIGLLNQDSEFPSATCRFHRRRADETWLKEDIDSYEDEAVFIFDL